MQHKENTSYYVYEETQYDDLPSRPFKTKGGVRLPHLKSSADYDTEIIPLPERVLIPLSQHIGAPCEPTVAVGDTVAVGQVIGDSSAFMSAPIHASVSGKVSAIKELLMPSGMKTKAIEIEADGLQTMWEGIKAPTVTNAKELCAAARACGLVGLGGAGFPTHVKLNIPEGKRLDTLVLCGAECEPYLTSDYREMVEGAEDILDGIQIITDILGIDRTIIGIEANKPEAIRIINNHIKSGWHGEEGRICVLTLKEQYPQGAEKVLIQATTGRVIPSGKLPSDVGVLVMNVTSVAVLARYLKDGVPLINKRVTVEGSAIVEPKNVIAPIGTPIIDLIDFCGGYRCEPRKLLMGGPMMGFALFDDEYPVLKQNNGFVIMGEEDVNESETTECIRCGRCATVCPMSLQPFSFEHKVDKKDADELAASGVMTCLECGSCAFVCPARRKLVQFMRLGKNIVRKAGAKK